MLSVDTFCEASQRNACSDEMVELRYVIFDNMDDGEGRSGKSAGGKSFLLPVSPGGRWQIHFKPAR